MKKIKRVLAMIMAMAMVMGLSMTVSAANEATITISNAGDGKFSYVKVIEPDPSTDTGWDFVEGYASYFTKEDAFNTDDTQAIIKGLIFAENPNASEGEKIDNFVNKYAGALKNVWDTLKDTNAAVAPLTVDEGAGLYVIRGFETNYNYSPMAVFIGMAYTTGKPSGVVSPEAVEAKKAPEYIEKIVDDMIVETNQEVTYTVTSTVPYFPDHDTNRWYVIKDTIKGAAYKLDGEGKTMTVNVKVGDVSAPDKDQDFTVTPGENTFTLDLTDNKCGDFLELADNTHANKTITITYKAIVTGLVIDNDVYIGEGENGDEDKYGSDHEDVISGTVTLVKTDDNEDEGSRIPLEGAEFVVQKTENEKTLYAIFDKANKLTGWTEYLKAPENNPNVPVASVLITDAQGEITVDGLAPDTDYEFKEIKAPGGYSISETNAKVEWSDEDITEEEISKDDASAITGDASMADTKLANLPGTGGIGTTIFTIGGCAIMIAAAGLYFASRRKQENK